MSTTDLPTLIARLRPLLSNGDSRPWRAVDVETLRMLLDAAEERERLASTHEGVVKGYLTRIADLKVACDNLRAERDRFAATVESLRAQLHGMQDGALLRDVMAERDRLAREHETDELVKKVLREKNETLSRVAEAAKALVGAEASMMRHARAPQALVDLQKALRAAGLLDDEEKEPRDDG